MFDKDNSIQNNWSADMVSWVNEVAVIDQRFDYPRFIKMADEFMQKLVFHRGPLFRVNFYPGAAHLVASPLPLGALLLACIKTPFNAIETAFPRHVFCPYYNLLADKVRRSGVAGWQLTVDTLPLLEQFAHELRDEGIAAGFAKLVANQNRAAQKNAAGVVKYLDALHEKRAKLLVLRVELGLSRLYRTTLDSVDPSPQEIVRDFGLLLRLVKRKIPGLIGHIARLEYGPEKSYHYHSMFIFNGHEVREDVTLGKLIGELWKNEITKGRGTYHNCNAHKGVYAKLGVLGIGMIRHDDQVACANLRKAALYLAKADYYLKIHAPGLQRTFRKGIVKTDSKLRRGRRRLRV